MLNEDGLGSRGVTELCSEAVPDAAQRDTHLGPAVDHVEPDCAESPSQQRGTVFRWPTRRTPIGAPSVTTGLRCTGDGGWQRRGNGFHGPAILRGFLGELRFLR